MDKFTTYIDRLRESNNIRTLREVKKSKTGLVYNKRFVLNLNSNDYLGLSDNENFWNNFFSSLNFDEEKYRLSSSSSRLLSGNFCGYSLLEDLIKKQYKKEGCLVFNSGYHINVGVIPALCGKDDLILADKLVHASIIDGIRLSQSKCIRYRHLNYRHLEELLQKYSKEYANIFILSESIFSMDGHSVSLQRLVALKKKYNVFLYIDEAHSVGVRGNNGLGLVEEQNCLADIDFIVGTFGKALASQGAFLVCSSIFKEYLINTTRTFIYTTALPPISVYWTCFIFERLAALTKERAYLKKLSDYFREELSRLGLPILGDSNIIPLILKDNHLCTHMSTILIDAGYFVLPIRPPTVPKNTSRLRFSLTANIKKENLRRLIDLIKRNI